MRLEKTQGKEAAFVMLSFYTLLETPPIFLVLKVEQKINFGALDSSLPNMLCSATLCGLGTEARYALGIENPAVVMQKGLSAWLCWISCFYWR